jgi:hypothetical protein
LTIQNIYKQKEFINSRKMVTKNKRGQDLSIGTLILIVLGIIVLVLLILGFTMGWGNLWAKINIFGSYATKSDVINACKLAASSQDTYTFCDKGFSYKEEVGGQTTTVKDVKCTSLVNLLGDVTPPACPSGTGGNPPVPPATPAVTGKTCAQVGTEAGKATSWDAPNLATGKCMSTKTDVSNQVTDQADKGANQGKFCCMSS